MVLEAAADLYKLVISFRHDFGQLVDRLRGAYARDNVLALGVHQELTEQLLLTGCRVAGERNAGTRIVAGVAEDHHLDVDGSTPARGDVVHAAVVDRTRVVPRAEDRHDRAHKLFFRVGWEVDALFLLIFSLELTRQLLEVVGIQLGVHLDAFFLFHLVDQLLEVSLADLHDNVRIHLDEPAVGVIRKTRVVGLFRHDFDHFIIQTEVEDGVHHARHRSACARTDRNEQRVLEVAELLAGNLFEFGEVGVDFRLDLFVDLLTISIVLGACLGCDREPLRDRHSKTCHLRQVRTLASEQLTHRAVALGEHVNKFFAHFNLPPLL